jgi:hypothetical protein
MGLNNFTDSQLKEMINNPKTFFQNKENFTTLIGTNSTTRRRLADIMKYDLNMDKNAIKSSIEKIANATAEKITIDV